jgi:hypothetical protein
MDVTCVCSNYRLRRTTEVDIYRCLGGHSSGNVDAIFATERLNIGVPCRFTKSSIAQAEDRSLQLGDIRGPVIDSSCGRDLVACVPTEDRLQSSRDQLGVHDE